MSYDATFGSIGRNGRVEALDILLLISLISLLNSKTNDKGPVNEGIGVKLVSPL
ncbi:MAG TPA: hypothetical protein PKV77_10110 [Bacteroidales bacterium]|nr:hypothetical protein [Bacteroidales bacterium]HPV27509.1 hypothetical protein [Bacteroidales bacterium]